jgi:hypothetical protein
VAGLCHHAAMAAASPSPGNPPPLATSSSPSTSARSMLVAPLRMLLLCSPCFCAYYATPYAVVLDVHAMLDVLMRMLCSTAYWHTMLCSIYVYMTLCYAIAY